MSFFDILTKKQREDIAALTETGVVVFEVPDDWATEALEKDLEHRSLTWLVEVIRRYVEDGIEDEWHTRLYALILGVDSGSSYDDRCAGVVPPEEDEAVSLYGMMHRVDCPISRLAQVEMRKMMTSSNVALRAKGDRLVVVNPDEDCEVWSMEPDEFNEKFVAWEFVGESYPPQLAENMRRSIAAWFKGRST